MYHILSDYTRDLPEISTKGLEGSERSERSESPNSSESSERLEDSSQFSKKYVRVTERTERSARNDESVRRIQSIKDRRQSQNHIYNEEYNSSESEISDDESSIRDLPMMRLNTNSSSSYSSSLLNNDNVDNADSVSSVWTKEENLEILENLENLENLEKSIESFKDEDKEALSKNVEDRPRDALDRDTSEPYADMDFTIHEIKPKFIFDQLSRGNSATSVSSSVRQATNQISPISIDIIDASHNLRKRNPHSLANSYQDYLNTVEDEFIYITANSTPRPDLTHSVKANPFDLFPSYSNLDSDSDLEKGLIYKNQIMEQKETFKQERQQVPEIEPERREGREGREGRDEVTMDCGCLGVFKFSLSDMCDSIRDIFKSSPINNNDAHEFRRNLSERVVSKNAFERTRVYHY